MARKCEGPVVTRCECSNSTPCITDNIHILKHRVPSKSGSKRVVELSLTTWELEPPIEVVAMLLWQPIGDVTGVICEIEERKVFDGNSRFTREINFLDEPPALEETLLITFKNSFEDRCLEEVVAVYAAALRPGAPTVKTIR